MFGLPDGVPVASYGPRGCEAAIANIRPAVVPGVPAVLLANHGVLVFHRTLDLAIMVGGVVEEATQAGVDARAPRLRPCLERAHPARRPVTSQATTGPTAALGSRRTRRSWPR